MIPRYLLAACCCLLATALPAVATAMPQSPALAKGVSGTSAVASALPDRGAVSRSVTERGAPPVALATAQLAARGSALPISASQPGVRSEVRFSPTLTLHDRLLTEDTVWRGDILIDGEVTVAPQATLTVEPGTVIRFRRNGSRQALLMVQGRLIASGASEAPIVLTSVFAAPAAGDWRGVMLLGSEKKNLLENLRIEGAQTGIEALFSKVTLKNVYVERAETGMRFQDALVAMDGGGAGSCRTGMTLTDTEAGLRHVALQGNGEAVRASRGSLYLLEPKFSGNQLALSGDGCRLKIEGGAVLGNGAGLRLSQCEGIVSGMNLSGNKEYGVRLAASRMRLSGNRISGNAGSGLIVYDGSALAWNNAIYDNGAYDLYHAGSEPFRAPGNWWGGNLPRIFDNGGRGAVLYQPILPDKPALPEAP